MQLQEELRLQKLRIKDIQQNIQNKIIQKQSVEQRYTPLALSVKLDDMANKMNSSLEQQAESFCVNRNGFISPLTSSSVFPTATMSSTLSGMDVSTSSSSSATTSTTSTGDSSIHFNAVVEAFISQWRQDRVRLYVYQLKAESLRNLIKIQQKQAKLSQGQGMPYWQAPPQYPNFAQPSQQPQPQPQPPQQQQEQAQNKPGFGFKNLFGTWKS